MAVLDDIRQWWDEDSATYDNSPGHRPRTGAERAAWTAAMESLLPPAPAHVLDCGAGTGFLSLMAAQLGHQVTALDLSDAMLARLRQAAQAMGVSDAVHTVRAPADQPPSAEYGAVMERHLLWTLPDPQGALRAWRQVAGRLVLVESMWGNADPVEAFRVRARHKLHRWLGRPPDHHGEYSEEIRAALPLGRGTSPSLLIELAENAGWTAPRLVRLRDVEWATLLTLSPLERLLGVAPRFAIVAGA
jgi:SAM-dependent methyltransferase